MLHCLVTGLEIVAHLLFNNRVGVDRENELTLGADQGACAVEKSLPECTEAEKTPARRSFPSRSARRRVGVHLNFSRQVVCHHAREGEHQVAKLASRRNEVKSHVLLALS